MAMLAGQAGILTALVGAMGLFALALVAFPEFRRKVVSLGRGRSDVFSLLPPTRRGMLGLGTAAAEEPSPGADHAESSRHGGERPSLDAGASHHLIAIASLCSRVDIDVQKTLTQLAGLLPTALGADDAWACKIELMDSVFWSPGYKNPVAVLQAPLTLSGKQVGSIEAGPTPVSSSSEPDASADALLEAAASLASQMLERRADRFQTEKLRAELEARQAAIRQAARLAKIGAWEYDAGSGLFKWSDEIRRITGIDDDKPGRERERLIAKALLPAIETSLATRKSLDQEFSCRLADGSERCLRAIGDVDERGKLLRIVGIIRDITDDKEALSQLTHIANHDVLTELPNRRYFQEKLEGALRQRPAKGALVIIDIDRFKDLNDSSGHDVGDMLLRDFGRRLREAAANAFVARLGGDEFAVLLPVADRTSAEHLARTLIASLTGPLVVFGRSATVQVSAGLAMYPADGRTSTDLLKNADLALYEAKTRGRNMLVAYRREIREASEERIRIRAEVKEALPQKQFIPFYQPKIRLDTGEIAGFEALVRWNHPSGIRTPGYFHAALTDPELSRGLCGVMLDRIIADMARWQARELPFGRIAFNASSSEFSGFDLAGHLTWRLRSIGISPSRLGVEVTEAVFLDDAEEIVATLAELRRAGIEIALDDFGTGFASLTHLQTFPVDVIKIDQSFVRRLETDVGSWAITKAVLGLGHGLGKTVVAEGVETAEQARLLKEAGCDQVQGYYFGKPMPAENVAKFIENWRGAEQLGALQKSAA